MRSGAAVNSRCGTMRSTVTMFTAAAFTISESIHTSFGSTRTLPSSSAAWPCTIVTSSGSGVAAT